MTTTQPNLVMNQKLTQKYSRKQKKQYSSESSSPRLPLPLIFENDTGFSKNSVIQVAQKEEVAYEVDLSYKEGACHIEATKSILDFPEDVIEAIEAELDCVDEEIEEPNASELRGNFPEELDEGKMNIPGSIQMMLQSIRATHVQISKQEELALFSKYRKLRSEALASEKMYAEQISQAEALMIQNPQDEGNELLNQYETLKKSATKEAEKYKRIIADIEDVLIKNNVLLVAYWVNKFPAYRNIADDLFQVGLMGAPNKSGTLSVGGLMAGIRKYNPDKGFTFATYAAWWVRQAINNEIRQQRLIELPSHIYDRLRKYNFCRSKLEAEHEDASVEELAKMLKMPVESVEQLQLIADNLSVASLDQSLSDDDDSGVLMDMVVSNENVERNIQQKSNADWLEVMLRNFFDWEDVELEIIRKKFGLAPYNDKGRGYTLKEIGLTIENSKKPLSGERVRQIYENIVETKFKKIKDLGWGEMFYHHNDTEISYTS